MNLLSQSHSVVNAKPITFRHSNENRCISGVFFMMPRQVDSLFLICTLYSALTMQKNTDQLVVTHVQTPNQIIIMAAYISTKVHWSVHGK